MTDREQQQPLKKVQPININPPQMIENLSFSLQILTKVNKEEIVQNVRVHISEEESRSLEEVNAEEKMFLERDEDQQYYERVEELQIQEEENVVQEGNKHEQNQENMISNQVKQRDQHQLVQLKQNNQQSFFDQTKNQLSPLHQPQQQQVFTEAIHHKLSSQQDEPIKKNQINHLPPTPTLNQYNKIKYTYNELQDEEIALSSSEVIVSQQNVLESEEFIEKKQINNQVEKEEKEEKDGGMIDEEEKRITFLEEIKSNQSLEKRHVGVEIEYSKGSNQHQTENYQQQNIHKKLQEYKYLQQQKVFIQIQDKKDDLSHSKAQPQEHQSKTQQSQPNQHNEEQASQHPPISHQPTQHQQATHLSQSQQQQQQQSTSPFSLQRYKSIQPILQQLLSQLKSTLKQVKSDTASQYFLSKNKQNSKFFNNAKNSRSQSRNKQYGGNNSLQDIMERRRQNLLFGDSHSGKGEGIIKSGGKNQSYHQLIGRDNKDRVYVGMQGTKNKAVPYGLGNLGNVTQFDIPRQPYPDQTNPNDLSRTQDQQRQKLIINRQKINDILASSVSNFKKPQSVKNKLKSTSYFNHRNQPFYQEKNGQQQKNEDVSFVDDSQSSNQQQMSRKIIKSTNFSKLASRQPQSIQEIPSSQKSTIQQPKQQKAFFLQKPLTSEQHPFPTSITALLKIIKKYLQVIAEGKIDDIESFLNTTGEGLIAYNNLNEMINRKKLFKTALYFERAAIVAGVCYGYLMITEQRGYLTYQVHQMNLIHKVSRSQQVTKQSTQTLKQQSKQILKYMINLVSFCLNNCKLITKTIQDHLIKPYQQSITSQQPSKTKTKQSSHQHQLIEKQIYKRNIQTIKLNIQYTQQTLAKLFVETLTMAKKLAIDEDFGESFKNVTKLIQKHTIQESFYTLLQYFSFYLCLIKRQRSIPFLAVAPNPYLDMPEKYTLVIDFVSVFCYGTKKSKTFIFRPYSQHFLNQMAQYFDIVTVCDALPQQIDKIIDLLDARGVIKHRLYKYHMVEEKVSGRYTKSLERVGRDMDKVILLDVENNQVAEEARNTIFISEWKGSKNDSVLAELCSVLLSIVVNGLDCSRAAERIHQQMKVNLANGIRHINFGLNLKQDLADGGNNKQ